MRYLINLRGVAENKANGDIKTCVTVMSNHVKPTKASVTVAMRMFGEECLEACEGDWEILVNELSPTEMLNLSADEMFEFIGIYGSFIEREKHGS